jgi:hypothetical protein
VSFQGKLLPEWDARFKALKLSAQSDLEAEQLQAQVEIGGHRFEVLNRGRGRAAYVLVDNWFSISLASATTKSVPVAYVRISSEALVLEGLAKVLDSLQVVVRSVGVLDSGPHISRIDLCADFSTAVDLMQFECKHWVTRAHEFAKRFVQRKFSGWSIGLGGIVSARLYNKTLELQKSKKWFLHSVWAAFGYSGTNEVWRLEFEVNREAIVELGFDTTDDLESRIAGIWLYCTTKWLRLAIPNAHDETPCRWPTHPLWDDLTAAWAPRNSVEAAIRARKERIPSDEQMFIQGVGGFTSFMAANGITDLGEGLGEFMVKAKEFHEGKRRSFERYIKAKVLKKCVKFNTISTHIDTAEEREQR